MILACGRGSDDGCCCDGCRRRGHAVHGGVPGCSVGGCPDILAAERQARRLARRSTIEQLIYAQVQAAAGQAGPERAWKHRTVTLIESNPRRVTESSPQAMFLAASYPETVAAATTIHASRHSPS
jgi:hypothetical protein